jgi:hypothetical protein
MLEALIQNELPFLQAVSEAASLIRPNGDGSWSPKEELGHLIDSASNNHQRFVRAALEPEYRGPGYAQNAWVALHGYQETPWQTLVSLWYSYNEMLARLVANIPEDKLSTPCYIGAASGREPAREPVTLGFVIEDYVLHMRHHLDHLLQRPIVTRYPA